MSRFELFKNRPILHLSQLTLNIELTIAILPLIFPRNVSSTFFWAAKVKVNGYPSEFNTTSLHKKVNQHGDASI